MFSGRIAEVDLPAHRRARHRRRHRQAHHRDDPDQGAQRPRHQGRDGRHRPDRPDPGRPLRRRARRHPVPVLLGRDGVDGRRGVRGRAPRRDHRRGPGRAQPPRLPDLDASSSAAASPTASSCSTRRRARSSATSPTSPMPTPASEINLIETFADTKVIGLTINHENMTDAEVTAAITLYELELGIPATDALTRRRTAWSTWCSGPSRSSQPKLASAASMSAPRLEIDLDRIDHNARDARRPARPSAGISVTGVTKATLGSPEIARELLRAGVTALGDSRIENIEALRRAGIAAPMTLIRSPMLSQVDARRRARRREPATPSSTCSIALSTSAAVAGPAPRRRAHGRARRPPRGHHARRPRRRSSRQTLALPEPRAPRHRHQPRLPERRRARRSQHGASSPTLATSTRGEVRDHARHRVGRQLGQPRLGARPRRRRPDQRPPPRRVDPARPRAAARARRSTGCTPTRSPSSPRSSSRRSSRPRPWGETSQTAFGAAAPDRRPRRRIAAGDRRRSAARTSIPRPHAAGRHRDPRRQQRPPRRRSGRARRCEVGAEVRFQLDYGALLRAMTSPFVTRMIVPRD